MPMVCSMGCGDWGGKSLADWEADLENKDPMKRAEAANALGNIGSRGVPALTRALSDESTLVRCKAAQALGWCGPDAASAVEPLAKLLQDESSEAQGISAETLGSLGPAAKEALPALQEALKKAAKQGDSELQTIISEAIELINNQNSA